MTLNNLGNVYQALGELPRAIELYEQSLAIFRETNNRPGQADTLGNLGNAYKKTGDPERAIQLFKESLAICREVGRHSAEVNALHNLADLYGEKGDFVRAIDYYRDSLHLQSSSWTRMKTDRERAALLQQMQKTAKGLETALLQDGQVESALLEADVWRARGLCETLCAPNMSPDDTRETRDLMAAMKRYASKSGSVIVFYSYVTFAKTMNIYVVRGDTKNQSASCTCRSVDLSDYDRQ
eukprot:scaffold3423_cov153-Pinguiococcus_pyrenoidosus.AAC.1